MDDNIYVINNQFLKGYDMPVEFEFALPVSCGTTFENDKVVIQTATMRSEKDANIYARSCARYGATILEVWNHKANWFVKVSYEKDENGKVGPKYA